MRVSFPHVSSRLQSLLLVSRTTSRRVQGPQLAPLTCRRASWLPRVLPAVNGAAGRVRRRVSMDVGFELTWANARAVIAGPEIRIRSALPEAFPGGRGDDLGVFLCGSVSPARTQIFRRSLSWGDCLLMGIRIFWIPDWCLQIVFPWAVTGLFIYSLKHDFTVNL